MFHRWDHGLHLAFRLRNELPLIGAHLCSGPSTAAFMFFVVVSPVSPAVLPFHAVPWRGPDFDGTVMCCAGEHEVCSTRVIPCDASKIRALFLRF